MLASISSVAETLIGVRGKKLIKYGLLQARTALGRDPFTSDSGLDRALLPYLPNRPGFFVEAGANDGFTSSNTYYLEAKRGWRGLLVEAVPQLAAMARRTRKATVISAALGPPELAGQTIRLNFNDLGSRINQPLHFGMRWGGILGPNPTHVTATVRTLSQILDAERAPLVDLLSLDVEGYDVEALRGLDLSRHKPTLIVIETTRLPAVVAILSGYSFVGEVTPGDFLFAVN